MGFLGGAGTLHWALVLLASQKADQALPLFNSAELHCYSGLESSCSGI